MDTKSYLGQIRKIDMRIHNKQAEIDQLNTIACGTTVPSDNERVHMSGEKDKVCALVSRVVDLEREIKDLLRCRNEIISQIERVDDANSYDMLAQIYILRKELKVVAVEKEISYGHAKKLHRKAIAEFEKLYGTEHMRPNDT